MLFSCRSKCECFSLQQRGLQLDKACSFFFFGASPLSAPSCSSRRSKHGNNTGNPFTRYAPRSILHSGVHAYKAQTQRGPDTPFPRENAAHASGHKRSASQTVLSHEKTPPLPQGTGAAPIRQFFPTGKNASVHASRHKQARRPTTSHPFFGGKKVRSRLETQSAAPARQPSFFTGKNESAHASLALVSPVASPRLALAR